MTAAVHGCPVCGAAPARVHAVPEMMFGLREVFHYGECGECPLLWLRDPPLDESRFYPPDYEAHSTPAPGRLRRIALRLRDGHAITGRGLAGRILHHRLPNPRLRALRPLHLQRTARILDVGAGDGAVVRALLSLGFRKASGIDPLLPADLVEGDRVIVQRASIREVTGTFDLVMFHHSFEHMPDPREVLGESRRLLAPGGTCLLRIPVFPSEAWQRYGVHWVQLDAPRHHVLHSVGSVRRLAAETGFSLGDVVYDAGILQFWGSEQYAEDLPLRDPVTGRLAPRAGRLDLARRRAMDREAHRLNRERRGDQAVFYLA